MARGQSNGASALGGPRIMLLVATLALVLVGLVMVYSASVGEAVSNGSTDSSHYLFKQLLLAVVGGVAAFLVWKLCPPYRWRGMWTWVALAACYALLIGTALYGAATNGAQRWIYIGDNSIQPSEFAKIFIIIVGARVYADFRDGLLDRKNAGILALGGAILPMLILYVTQSDLGTTIIIFVGLLAMLWLGECPLKVILGIVAVAILFVVIATFFTSYRSDRLYSYDPWSDGQNGAGLGFQLIRSFYAFAQGGIFGAGIGNSTEKLTPLPEAETDFIFAIIGEELGLIGCVLVIALFFVFLVAGLLIANESEDPFARMLSGSLTVMIVFQAFLNMSCVTGLIPTTGKPLPFISSGGSSMLASLLMVGLILTAAPAGGKTSIYDKRRENLRIVRSVDSARVARASDAASGRGVRERLPLRLSLGDNGAARRTKTLEPVSTWKGRR